MPSEWEREEWERLNFEMVEIHGKQERRRSVDPDFDKRVEELGNRIFGVRRRDPTGRIVG